MSKLVTRGYIMEVVIFALISLFYIPKVTYYIYVVFGGTVSGLNDSLWVPNLMLTTMGILLIMVVPKTYMVGLDVGEMFNNFQLSSVLAKYCGVDLGFYLGHKKDQQVTPLLMRCLIPMMGLVFSPYASMRVLLWASKMVSKYSSDPNKPSRWDNIRSNLPGDPNNSPTSLCMTKILEGN